MDSSSGGSGEKDGGGDTEAGSSLGAGSLHDHSDLLIPNPNFISSPASVSSNASSMMMSITSPNSVGSDNDLQHQRMEFHMTSPQYVEDGSVDDQMDQLKGQDRPDSSPPNVIVDDSPLQPCMDRNKQSLKVKLLMRRPMNQLVEQGILPPPKTPAAFAGQRVRLERARMGDLLKAKIQQRPARQELIRQHILEDTDSRVAPSLAEKQRMLKRARLADSLNDHLIHRPGPLELVQKNILHAPDADIEKAIKEGHVSFKATSEGHVPGPSLPCKYTNNEDDSSSDISSPAGTPDASSSGHNTEANTPISRQLSDPAICLPSPGPAPTVTSTSLIAPSSESSCEVALQPAKPSKSENTTATVPPPTQLIFTAPQALAAAGQTQQLTQAIFHVTPATASVIPPPPPLPISSTTTAIPPPPPPPQTILLSDGAVRELLPQLQNAGFQLAAAAHVQKPSSISQSSSSLGKSRSSKKSSKSKSQPKARTIKFHEYKGPSNCQPKGGASSSGAAAALAQSKAESSYELLLKQQQLFLQWQLEWQHKYPQILLPAAPKTGPTGVSPLGSTSSKATLSSFPVTAIPASLCTHILNSNNQQTSSQQTTPSATTITVASAVGNETSNQRPITLAPKVTEIAPKPPEFSSFSDSKPNDSVASPGSATSEKSTSIKSLSLSNIGDWKVNDLKVALKRRNLPVSGSKSQLVERLKAATTKETKDVTEKSVKMEVTSADENSSEAMMEVSNSAANDDANKSKGSPQIVQQSQAQPVAIGTPVAPQQMENNNISILDLASGKLNGVPISLQNILSLLGVSSPDGNVVLANNNNAMADNNLKNTPSGVVQAAANTTAKVISQLPISTVVATAAKAVAAAAAATSNTDTSSSVNSTQNHKLVDENKILEQQKQILELQKALRISQQQLAQQKDQKNGGPQKHRLVLQQHIHQKLQQQAIQNQLQNLIQLQTQQAEQKKQLLQQQQQQNQSHQPQLVLISGNSTQPVANIGNNVLPVTIVSQPTTQTHQQSSASQINLNSHWIPQQTQQQHDREANKSVSSQQRALNFEDLVQNIVGNAKEAPKLESGTDARKNCVKSQMVDDVLEILIRNGELPPSAAQDPQTKISSAQSSNVSTTGSSGGTTNGVVPVPPPPPPLPPPTFSVMLPTTIPFSRHQTTNNTDFLTFGGAGGNGVKSDEHLSKDAQEILRICEDLSNFGKSREAEAAAANSRLTNGNMDCGFFTQTSRPHTSTDKDFDLSDTHNSANSGHTNDSMDIGFGDTHSVSLHSTGNKSQSFANANHHQYQNSPFDSGTFSFGQSNSQPQQQTSTFKSLNDHHHNFMSDDDLLPVSLDMQMDTDYSDWLDALLPDSGNNGSTTGTNLFSHQADTSDASANKINSEKRQDHLFNHNNNLSNSSSHNSTSNNVSNIFSSLLDDSPNHQQQPQQPQVHHSQQRDPLLSSRSFNTSMNGPFIGDVQQQSYIFAPQHHNSPHNLLIFQNPPSVGSTSSTATMMDTDFDELTTSVPTTISNPLKKSDCNVISASSHNNITEMPSTTSNIITAPIITTTSSINDNFLWDFAM